jgi:hypothetical protein
MKNLLVIFVNGILQEPDKSYQFEGGTTFVFTSAPKPEDNIAIFFYRGTSGDDTKLVVNINETIKRGDTVQVLKNNSISGTISQNERTVFDLSFSDKFETNLYSDQGVDTQNYKPLSWTKQKVDRKINGENVYKTRDSIESLVYPTAKIIKDFSTTSNEIFIDYGPGIGNTINLFNYENYSCIKIQSCYRLYKTQNFWDEIKQKQLFICKRHHEYMDVGIKMYDKYWFLLRK